MPRLKTVLSWLPTRKDQYSGKRDARRTAPWNPYVRNPGRRTLEEPVLRPAPGPRRAAARAACIALNNFWRSLSNLTINVTGLDGCRSSANFWAASQASPMRRVNINGGNLSLMDYCTAGPQFASGGFISDSKTGSIINGSQQQYFVRDSSIGDWSNGVWNQVFSGVEGAPAQSFPLGLLRGQALRFSQDHQLPVGSRQEPAADPGGL